MQAAAYAVHSYRNPVIGWKTDLTTMTRDDLYGHYRTFYTPSNAVVVATGDFDPEAMLTQIDAYFGALPGGPATPALRLHEPEQRAERRVVVRGEDPVAYFMQAFHAPPASHDDFFPVIVMDSVLGGAKGMGIFGGSANNRSNRLYKALVETELTVDVHSSYGPNIDPGLFTISATLAPETTHAQVEDAIWAARASRDRLANDGVLDVAGPALIRVEAVVERPGDDHVAQVDRPAIDLDAVVARVVDLGEGDVRTRSDTAE